MPAGNRADDTDAFDAWVRKEPLPDGIQALGIALFHKRGDGLKVIDNAGHTREYLPPYRPGLNDIGPVSGRAKPEDDEPMKRPNRRSRRKRRINVDSSGYVVRHKTSANAARTARPGR